MKQKIKQYFGKLIVSAIFVVLISAVSISAATFTVTNTNDSGAGSLRQAILDANAAAGDDVINFDASFNSPQTITLTSGELSIDPNGALTINGTGPGLLTISGNLASRIFHVLAIESSAVGNATINNLQIKDGRPDGAGGGILVNTGNNDAFGRIKATLTVNNVVITNNQAQGSIQSGAGGGIGCFSGCEINVNNSVTSNNYAPAGGAIYHQGVGFPGTNAGNLNVNNSTFEGNSANNGGGGAIQSGIRINIDNSTFNKNSVTANHIFRLGSDIYLPITIKNSTIANNTITNSGSAIGLYRGNTLTLDSVTIANNENTNQFRSDPGGIWVHGNDCIVRSKNSIIANNTNPNGGNDLLVANANNQFISEGYNLIENPTASTIIGGNTTGNIIGVDPALDTMVRENGGSTKSLALRPGSPAVDAGSPTDFLPTDQRGINRPVDGDGNGTAISDIGAFERRLTDTVPSARFDFDGDVKSDISVFRPSNGAWYINQSTNGFTGVTFGLGSDLIAPADFDGDGRTDIAVFRPSNGAWYYLKSSDNSFVGVIFGQNGDLPRPADFDGDGKADINVFRPSNGAWYRLNSSNGSFFGTIFGQNGDQPLQADFDGDSKSDIAVFRPGAGAFYWLQSSTGQFKAIGFGLSTDIPTMGDFDGDNRTDIAVFRPSNGAWYRYNSTNGAFVAVGFGQNGDIPVTGDYDGDGKSEIAVFRPSNGTWYYQNSSNGGFVGVGFGLGTDIPIPAAFSQ